MRKLVDCEHCGGARQCRKKGGRSCDACLAASGRKRHDWATVRCSYCGGRGKLWIEEEEKKLSEGEAATG